MLPPLLPLRETHIVGPRCVESVLAPERFPQLRRGRFAWVGHSRLLPPYRMVRRLSAFAHIVVCTQGEGRVVINGQVVPFRSGQALLAPSAKDHAFEACGEEPWHISWIFANDRGGPPLVDAPQPRLITAEVTDFAETIRLLAREAFGEADPTALQAWVSLLQIHTFRLVGGTQLDPRLSRLWREVELDLAHPWTMPKLARIAAVSEEHLRRLCHRHYRRSPASYLTRLRLQRAGVLLRASNATVETVAMQVGFGSVHAFSHAFKRWSGLPPSRYRHTPASAPASSTDLTVNSPLNF